jgi:23S rRNA (pseudouridine1915-N3)-methyltransferase
MELTVHTVCGRLPGWVDAGVEDYQRRLPREIRLSWRDLPLAKRHRNSRPEQLRQEEGVRLLKGVPDSHRLFALDLRGQLLSTEDLAAHLRSWQMDGQGVSLLIGGPDGLSAEVLARCEQRWSLGRMTLPHPLVRVVLAEQVYRAWTVTAGHPYHRA